MIEKIRNEIDVLDKKIVGLINERFKLAGEIGNLKRTKSSPVYVPERESLLLEKLSEVNAGPMDNDSLFAIYREIMSAARKLEDGFSVACLGPEGTYSHQAALEIFGHGTRVTAAQTIKSVFREVEAGRSLYGVLPVENSTEGVVNPTLDCLTESDLLIVNEYRMKIHHQLLGFGKFEDISCIYSHPQVFGQCRDFIENNLPSVRCIEVASSARAAELAARETSAAALAGKAAGELYSLPVIRENVEDDGSNTTRFLVLGKQRPEPTGHDKTSLCFVLRDQAGALYDALSVFNKRGISLSMIESRPFRCGGSKAVCGIGGEYCFFVDMPGHISDPEVASACDELKGKSLFFRLFGSYPEDR